MSELPESAVMAAADVLSHQIMAGPIENLNMRTRKALRTDAASILLAALPHLKAHITRELAPRTFSTPEELRETLDSLPHESVILVLGVAWQKEWADWFEATSAVTGYSTSWLVDQFDPNEITVLHVGESR